jgi:hypothetical protein
MPHLLYLCEICNVIRVVFSNSKNKKMKTLPGYIPFLLIAMLLYSCYSSEVAESKDVNQAKIFQYYSIVKNEEYGTLKVKAKFRFGGEKGTTLILSAPASVQINDQVMQGREDLFQGYAYKKSDMDFANKDFSFIYRDLDGKIYTNSISTEDLTPDQLPDSLDPSRDFILEWKGKAVGNSETVYLDITDKKLNKKSFRSDLKGSRSILIEATALNDLYPGMLHLKFRRELSRNTEQSAEIGGYINSVFISRMYEVRLGQKPAEEETEMVQNL